MYKFVHLVIFCFTLSSQASGSAVYVANAHSNVQIRADPTPENCAKLTGTAPECFQLLGTPQYIQNWVKANGCSRDEGFSSCYLRLNNFSTQGCSERPIDQCPTYLPGQLGSATGSIVLYTVNSIYSLYAWTDYWYKTVETSANYAFSRLVNVLQAVNNTMPSAYQDITNEYKQAITGARASINRTGSAVLADSNLFLDFVSSGNFSIAVPGVNPANDFQRLNSIFLAYLVAKAMNVTGTYVTVGRDTSPFALTTNHSKLAYPIKCSTASGNTCDAWYYSEDLNTSFGPVADSSPTTNFGDTIKNLLNFTSGRDLFDRPLLCNLQDPNNSHGSNFTVNASGPQFDCFTRYPTFTWDMYCHSKPLGKDDASASCEFIEGPKSSGFWDLASGGKRKVPAAYLGPALTQGAIGITRA